MAKTRWSTHWLHIHTPKYLLYIFASKPLQERGLVITVHPKWGLIEQHSIKYYVVTTTMNSKTHFSNWVRYSKPCLSWTWISWISDKSDTEDFVVHCPGYKGWHFLPFDWVVLSHTAYIQAKILLIERIDKTVVIWGICIVQVRKKVCGWWWPHDTEHTMHIHIAM